MIKLIIFDLDGVLYDSKEFHFESLNKAISQFDSQYLITKKNTLTLMMVCRQIENSNY